MTTPQQHVQLWRFMRTQSRLGVGAGICLAISIICVPQALTKERGLDKLLTLGVGLAATEAARRLSFGYYDWRDTDADLVVAEKRALIQQHKHILKEESKAMAILTPAIDNSPEDTIYNVVDYWLQQQKHLLIVGGTGSGKSTFVKNFCKQLTDWQVKVYDIDATVDDWKFAHNVFYDFSDIETQMKDDLDIIPSIREQRRVTGANWKPEQPLLMIADEFPALIGEFPTTAKKWLATHAKQTRKHQRMVAVMAQNDTVSNLGLKGDVSVRDTCFTCVYLGDKAYDKAKSIGKPELVDWLRQAGFSGCMIDDKPAFRP